ncbi:MAG: ketose-bisphosphate aldolase [Patescibacteria group bacterium]
MKPLEYYFEKALKEKWAIPQFNFSNLEILKAIIEAAKELKSPVILGTSEGESRFLGIENAVALVKNFREQFSLPIFLNLDHGKSFDSCKAAIDKGYDTCEFDGSELKFDENIETTKKLVQYAKEKKVSIGGEMEEIGSGNLTDPDKAVLFYRETGIHRLAVNIGTGHAKEGKIDFFHLKKIKERVGDIPLVLHGASGVSEEEIKEVIKIGINKININTALRKAFRDALKDFLNENSDEIVPYKYMPNVIEKVREVAENKIKLLGSLDKA